MGMLQDWYNSMMSTYPSDAYWTSLNVIAKSGDVMDKGTTWWRWGTGSLADVMLLYVLSGPINFCDKIHKKVYLTFNLSIN